ncbi:MAG: hypothetical protein FXF47_00870, partial [Candidatus Mcinerneyibacterium aminivorans]
MILNVETYLSILNKSISTNYKIKNWKHYRQEVVEFIKSNIKLSNYKNAAVFAAGDCGDIDLRFLSQNFEEILLTDISSKNIKIGIKKQLNPTRTQNFSIKTFDYTGLDKNDFYKKIIELLLNKEHIEKIKDFITEELNSLNADKIYSTIPRKYNIVISLPVYSQLFYQHIIAILDYHNIYKKYSKDKLSNFKTFLLNKMPIIIDNYNSLLHNIISKDGILISLIDMLEYKNTSATLQKISKDMNNNLIENQIKKSGYGISNFALDNLKKYFSIINSKWLLWPFNKKRTYLVK